MTDSTVPTDAPQAAGVLVHEELVIELPVARPVLNAIRRQVAEGVDFRLYDPHGKLDALLTNSLDSKYALPSQVQLKFAHSICRRLGLEFTENLESSKEECGRFLNAQASAFFEAVNRF